MQRVCKRLATVALRGTLPARFTRSGLFSAFSTSSSQQRVSRIPKKDVVTVTEAAAQRIKALLENKKDSKVAGVRLGVKTRGCNGLSFVLGYQEEGKGDKFDEKVSAHGVDVYIDSKAVFYIVGTKMDWIEDDLRAEFTFDNPNAKGQCGCGESFNV
mmetsp:Transcript_17046/g.23855  ORF Transcript_17046/g.23855 Transcript_17046/m.23855 type:complete len:157 (-) Transcript_17046:195-665(-)